MRQPGRLLGNTGRLRDAVLRHCTVGKPVVHAVYFLAEIEAGSILTGGRNDAGEFMSWYSAATVFSIFAVSGGIPQQLRRRHTSRIDAD